MIPDITYTISRKGGGKGGSDSGNTSAHSPNEAPNTLRSRSTARILEVLSEGVIDGLVTGDLRSVYLDGTPVINEGGTVNFNVDEYFFRNGLPDQDVVPGFSAGESEISVGVEMQPTIPVVRSITLGVDSLRIKTRVQALYSQSTNGDVNGSSVEFDVDMNIGGAGWTNVYHIVIAGKTMSPYERSIRVVLPSQTQNVDVRLTRTTPEPGSETQNTVAWSSFTEIVDGKMIYEDTALAAMTVDAQYFPNVPTRGYLLRGIICQVPSNYDPITRIHVGDWDGTFVNKWTNNPSWILWDLITHPRYGLGRDLDVNSVDKWSFYEASVYNDGDVSNGRGGREVRFTCNVVIATREDAFLILQSVASSMRSLLYYSNGTLFLVQDRPSEPTRLFSPANVTNGIFDYASSDYRSQFNAVNVMWINPDLDYTQAVELVMDPEYISQYPYRDTNQVAYACTRRGQAIRHGRWSIFTGNNELELMTFRTSIEYADVRPGEVIMVTDPSRVTVRLGGRTLAHPVVGEIEIDSPTEEIVEGWKIYVALDGPSIIELTVVSKISPSVYGVTGTVEIIPQGVMWIAHDFSVEPMPWRVTNVKENKQNEYEILATFYDYRKYPYVDEGIRLPPVNFTLLPTGPLVNGSDIIIKEYIYRDGGGTPQFGVIVSWEPSPDPRVAFYMLEMAGPNSDYRKVANIVGMSTDVPLMRSGPWTATLYCVDNLGRRSIPITLIFVTTGLTQRPLPPTALYANVNGGNVQLEWIPTGEIDVVYWWIAWHPETDPALAKWETATSLATRISYQTLHTVLPARRGTYFIKPIDSLGQTSFLPAKALVDSIFGPANQIVDMIEEPAWAGTLGSFSIVASEIWMYPPATQEFVAPEIWPGLRGTTLNQKPMRYSYYGFDNSLDMGEVGDALFTALIDAYGTIGNVTMSTWIPLASAQPLAKGTSNNWDVSVEVRVSIDDVVWGPWTPLKTGLYKFRSVEVRLVGLIYDIETTLKIKKAHLSIDVPDRVVKGEDIAFDGVTGQAVVVYTPHFYQKPNLQLTGVGLPGSASNIAILASTKDGFTVEHRDSTGAPLPAGTFNYQATGFGVS